MPNPRSLLNHLEACVRADLEAQGRVVARLQEQEQAVLAKDHEALESATRALDVEVERGRERSSRRTKLVAALGAHWSVAPSALTLASIAERSGADGRRLDELRAELRAATATAFRAGRRAAALLALHRDLIRETLDVLLGADGASPLQVEGALVDAEG